MLDEADQLFFSFVRSLCPSLGNYLLRMETYSGQNSNKISAKIKSLRDVFGGFIMIPLFFGYEPHNFREVELKSILMANCFGWLYAIVTDKLIDGQYQLRHNAELNFLSSALCSEAARHLCNVFNNNSGFWSYYRRCFAQYHEANLLEKKLQRFPDRINMNSLIKIARGKGALLKIGNCALALLSRRLKHLHLINRSIDNFNIALQFRDDAHDWKDDINTHQPSFIIIKLKRLIKQSITSRTRVPDTQKIEISLFLSDILESTIEDSTKYFVTAEKIVRQLGCTAWKSYIKYYIEENNIAIEKILQTKFYYLIASH